VPSKGEVEGSNQGSELVDELGLDFVLVGVPDAVEETLPDLLEVEIGNVSLGFEPSPEKLDCCVASLLVAGGQVLCKPYFDLIVLFARFFHHPTMNEGRKSIA
jgi:hypothetical protein